MTKSLYEAPVKFNDVGSISRMEFAEARLNLEKGNFEEVEKMLDNLQWAKEFMNAYERKHKINRIRKQTKEVNRVL